MRSPSPVGPGASIPPPRALATPTMGSGPATGWTGWRRRVVAEVGDSRALDLEAQELLDLVEIGLLFGAHQSVGVPAALRSRRATHAMNVDLGLVRHVVVHDVAYALHVDPTCRDVGRHQDSMFPTAEPFQSSDPLALAAIPVNDRHGNPPIMELASESVGSMLGAGEDEDARHRLVQKQLPQEGGFEVGGDRER